MSFAAIKMRDLESIHHLRHVWDSIGGRQLRKGMRQQLAAQPL